MCVGDAVWLVGVVSVWQAGLQHGYHLNQPHRNSNRQPIWCNTDTNPTSQTETPTHIETRTHDQCGDTIEKTQAPDNGCINVRNLLSIEEVK